MKNVLEKLKNRRLMNLASQLYYRLVPAKLQKSERFHLFLYGILIGRWFNVNFLKQYKHFSQADWVKLYDQLFLNRIREEDLTQRQKKYVISKIKGSSVLDVGCGTGKMIEALLHINKVKRIVGNDISPAAIQYLAKKFASFPQIKYIEGDFLEIETKERFDTVLCLHVLEHIVDIRKFVQKILTIAKKRLIIIVPNEKRKPFPPNYHLHFFNSENPIIKLFPFQKKTLKQIDGDYVLVVKQ